MNFETFKWTCPWRVKKIQHLMDLYHPDSFIVGNIYPIGSVIIKHGTMYMKTEIKDTKDMWFNRRHWIEFASTCAATNMTCRQWNCGLFYTKEQLLKQISLW